MSEALGGGGAGGMSPPASKIINQKLAIDKGDIEIKNKLQQPRPERDQAAATEVDA
jgi:hypothetical protein